MPVETLQVDLGDRAYPIYVGEGLLRDAAFVTDVVNDHFASDSALLISNTTVAPLYADRLKANLGLPNITDVVLEDGERHKNLATLASIFDQMMAVPCDRSTTVIALGGGVVGDIAGFAAACYQRGVPYIQVPTTLLAQVDSSVGGKTAVNHPKGKNMIGAFYQPRAVIIDVDTLTTLDRREFRAGLAEVIKYGLIRDRDFFAWLEDNLDALMAQDAGALVHAVRCCCRNKAEVVAADEHERGQRALLNLGHTFGHAIETATGYTEWLHGEAVAAGTMMALDLSVRCSFLGRDDLERVAALYRRAGLRAEPPAGIDGEQYLQLMRRDKKVSDGNINLVLLNAIGDAFLSASYGASQLNDTLAHFGAG